LGKIFLQSFPLRNIRTAIVLVENTHVSLTRTASRANKKNGFSLRVFPDFRRKNNKIKSRSKDQTL
jgi:hypothetical protein